MIQEQLGVGSEAVCQLLHLQPGMCDSRFWRTDLEPLINISGYSFDPTGCARDFWSCYDPDAIVFGGSLSGSFPGVYSTSGIELLEMDSDGALALYGYGGEGSSAGAGANAAAYFGVVANLANTRSYAGPFASVGVTVSFFGEGVTVSYFWDSLQKPMSPHTTQGIAAGWAPGAALSVWGASTFYTEIGSTDH